MSDTQYVVEGYWNGGYADGDRAAPPFDVSQTIIAQYANSRTLVQICKDMQSYIRPEIDLQNFYDFVWNIDTAQGFGLDILGRIVNVGRLLKVPAPTAYFGFREGGASYLPFGKATFYTGVPATQVYSLSDDAYRTLILMKALLNISDASTQSLNRLLNALFRNRGRCYVQDLGDMQIRLVFEFALLPYELAILTQSTAQPRPTAVKMQVAIIRPATTFGFAEAGGRYASFGQGSFFNPTTGIIDAS